ncbi:MAG: hypothetical protein QM796_20680 [Chthoniobacteraceae bacterium]
MSATLQTEGLLSLNHLSRRLNITYSKALELQMRGVLVPDFTANHIHLFRPARLPEIMASVKEALKPRFLM